MKPLLHWVDLYREGTLDDATKEALFDFLNQNMEAKDEWDELIALEELFEEQKERVAFQATLKDIASKQPNQKTKTRWLFPLKTWRYTAAAALLVGISSFATWSIFNQDKKQHTHEYLQLRKEVESIKYSQIALIKNINEEQNEIKRAWQSKYSGTGFSIHKDGYLVTNYHVVKDAHEIMVEDQNGTHYPAYMIAFDNKSDIAILKINDSTYHSPFETLPFTINAEAASLAEPIFSLGYPINSLVYHEGYISGEEGFSGQIDAYLLELTSDPGQSGAPVFNQQGEVIGVITGKQKNTQGKTYAIQVSNLIDLIQSLPEENQIDIKQSNQLKNQKRTQQVAKLREHIYAIKVN